MFGYLSCAYIFTRQVYRCGQVTPKFLLYNVSMFSETSAALTWLERTIIYFPVLLIIS